MREKATVRETEKEVYTHYASVGEALVAAIRDLQTSGGGIVWIHHPACDGRTGDLDCPCDPVPVTIEPVEVN